MDPKVRERKLKITSRKITVKNYQITIKFRLDLHIPMMYPYIEFELNVCNGCIDNERKLHDDRTTEQGNTICPQPLYA
jgi:hypothetical protein